MPKIDKNLIIGISIVVILIFTKAINTITKVENKN